MSIIDSSIERTNAERKVANLPAERIREDLEFWSVAAHDARDDLRRALEAHQAAGRRFAEAQEWVELLVTEARRRRDVRVGA